MDTIADWSDINFNAPQPGDVGQGQTWREFLGRTATTPFRSADIGRVADAAAAQQRYIENGTGQQAQVEDAYDQVIDRVKAASGIQLQNPMRMPVALGSFAPGDGSDASFADWQTNADRERQSHVDDFNAQFAGILKQYPEIGAIDPAALGRQAALSANQASGAVDADLSINPLVKGIGGMIGGFQGGDQRFWAENIGAMMLPELKVVKALPWFGRIAAASVEAGAVNTGLQALNEPSVVANRQALGLPSDVAGDLEGAFAGGALLGGAFHSVTELAGALRRLARGTATAEDVAAVEKSGGFVSDETRSALDGARFQDEANAELAKSVPETVPSHEAPAQIADGLAAVEDPAQPLPLVDRAVEPGTSDAPAIAAIEGASSPAEAIAALRVDDADFAARVEAAARAENGDLFARADRLESDLAAARSQIAALQADRDRITSAPAVTGNASIQAATARIAEIEQELAGFTGKRRTSPGAKALRAEMSEAQATIAASGEAGQQLKAASLAKIDDTIAILRSRLVEHLSDRGRLGPEINAARESANAKVASEAPSLVSSALSSPHPQVRDMGRVATLDPTIADRVVAGDVRPDHAAIVAATTHDPGLQAAALAAINEAHPATLAEARVVASDAVSAANAPAAEAARMGALPFGPQIAADASPSGWSAAVERLRTLGTGEIIGALSHPEIGGISVPWQIPGDLRHGLKGLLERGRADVVAALPEIIRDGIVTDDRRSGRVVLETADHGAVIRLDWQDDPASPVVDKRWMFTAFEKNDRIKDRTTLSPELPTEAVSLPPPVEAKVSPKASDIKDLVPLVRDDGSVAMVTRDELGRVADRENWMADVVNACKL